MPSAECEFRGCGRGVAAKGLCSGHYYQAANAIELRPIPVKHLPLAEKLQRDSMPMNSGCVEWVGSLDRNGYGRVWHEGRHYPAHRASLANAVGEIPADLVVNHICQNPPCINPDHLEAITRGANTQFQKQRKRDLPRGVYRAKRAGTFRAQAQKDGVLHYFGTHDTLAEAEAAVIEGRERIGMHNPQLKGD